MSEARIRTPIDNQRYYPYYRQRLATGKYRKISPFINYSGSSLELPAEVPGLKNPALIRPIMIWEFLPGAVNDLSDSTSKMSRHEHDMDLIVTSQGLEINPPLIWTGRKALSLVEDLKSIPIEEHRFQADLVYEPTEREWSSLRDELDSGLNSIRTTLAESYDPEAVAFLRILLAGNKSQINKDNINEIIVSLENTDGVYFMGGNLDDFAALVQSLK